MVIFEYIEVFKCLPGCISSWVMRHSYRSRINVMGRGCLLTNFSRNTGVVWICWFGFLMLIFHHGLSMANVVDMCIEYCVSVLDTSDSKNDETDLIDEVDRCVF